MWELYPQALDAGIMPETFWNLSLIEICDLLESCNRRRIRNAREQLSMLFAAAESTAEHIGCYLNEKNTARRLWDFFPSLFAEEKEAYEKEQAEERTVKAVAEWKAYAAEWNRRRKAGLV